LKEKESLLERQKSLNEEKAGISTLLFLRNPKNREQFSKHDDHED
jgi:hypothetical protein